MSAVAASSSYYFVLASLPALPARFPAGQSPINPVRLRERLGVLDEEDQADLRLVEELLHWERLPASQLDAHTVGHARAAEPRLRARGVHDLVRERLELRTALAALRRRAGRGSRPRPGEAWGYGRWTGHIERHWDEPHFALDAVHPWLPEVERLLAAGNSQALERFLLEHVWERLGRAAEGHHFDFRAVVVYVLRWNVLERWSTYDAEAAVERFGALCEEALAALPEGAGAAGR